MKITLERIVILFLAAVLTASLFRCSDIKNQLTAKQVENQRLDSIVNKYGQTIYTQEVVIINSATALKKATDSFFALTAKQDRRIKDVIAFYKGITSTQIRDVPVPYIDTLGLQKWEDSVQKRCADVIAYYEANTISVPRTAGDSTKNYKVKFTVRQDSLVINNIEFPDSQYIRFVTTKGGFLKKDTYGKRHFILGKKIEAQIKHTNDSLHVRGQTSIIVKAPKKARIAEKALLIGAGLLLGTKL